MKSKETLIGEPSSNWNDNPCFACKKPLNVTYAAWCLCQDCRKELYQGLCRKLFPGCDLTPDPTNVYIFAKEIQLLEQYYGPMGVLEEQQQAGKYANVWWAEEIGNKDFTGCVERSPDG